MPGMFDFAQAKNSTNPLWRVLVGAIHRSSSEEKKCQAPKSILIPTGSLKLPDPWAPEVLPIQILKLGQLVMLVVPTEMTTMAGRRLRQHIRSRMMAEGLVGKDAVVVIAGLGNSYASYTTTFEEYQIQRYEGASTIYGPHQLNALIQEFSKLVKSMAQGEAPTTEAAPVDFTAKLGQAYRSSRSAMGRLRDEVPQGASHMGQVMTQAGEVYKTQQTVTVSFAAANPLNNLRHQGSFCEVQRCMDADCREVSTVAVDGDWETKIRIKTHSLALPSNIPIPMNKSAPRELEVEWNIPASTPAGQYRIVHNGTFCLGNNQFQEYSGISKAFYVIPVPPHSEGFGFDFQDIL